MLKLLRCSQMFVLLGLACLCVLPASAQDISFVTEPPSPTAGEPFRLVFSGGLVGIVPSDSAEDRCVHLEDDTIVVTQLSGFAPVPLPILYVASIEVGPLAEGTWQVELRFESEGTSPPVVAPTEKNLGSIFVGAPVEIAGPSIGYSNSPVQFTVSRVDTCSELGDITVDSEERSVSIPWRSGCPILPPDPELIELETGAIGPLEPGDWTVEVIDALGHPMARKTLEVLPNPVRLQDDRFEIDIAWFNNLASEKAFPVIAPTRDSALYAFFISSNWEVMLKVLDGCEINDHFWVFSAANTDQGYDILVTDTQTGLTWEYHNDLGTASPAVTDIEAFPCP